MAVGDVVEQRDQEFRSPCSLRAITRLEAHAFGRARPEFVAVMALRRRDRAASALTTMTA
jgi:hypothetical protein